MSNNCQIMEPNINNLNIFTFIKDIYKSLKHIDKCFNDSNTNINSRLSKIEDNQLILLNKLSEIEIILQKSNDINTSNILINKNIENELLEKMKKMNTNNLNNSKIELKQSEMTFANILENNYSLQDISLLQTTNNIRGDNNSDRDHNIDSDSGSGDHNIDSFNNMSNDNDISNYSFINNYNKYDSYNNIDITDGISDGINLIDNSLNNLLF